MTFKNILSCILLFLGLYSNAQETVLNLKDAVTLAVTNSNEASLANSKVVSKKLELGMAKNAQYPDLKVSGQYMRLTGASINSNLLGNSSNNNASTPNVNQLWLAQANVSLPIFAGFKIQNSIQANQNLYQAEISKSVQAKEEIAMRVVENYANLYRAQKSVTLITENLKSAEQRVKDFTNLEKNGVIARNDLLKVQLQQSKIQLSLDEAKKNVTIINYYLITLMKLPENYVIKIDEHQFDAIESNFKTTKFEDALSNRKDLEAIHYFEKAAQNSIKIAKSNYYPSIAFRGGYTNLGLENVATITNAINLGLAFSYDLSSFLKNGKEVSLAKNKLTETKQNEAIITENIKIQVQQATENYSLTLKQNIVYKEAIEQANENYRIVKNKYDNGLSNTNDLLEADVEQLNAKLNHALSRANSFLKYYEMQSAAGLLTSSFDFTKQ